MSSFFRRHEKALAIGSIICIFLGVIRCIGEPFRLYHSFHTPPTWNETWPYLLGGAVAACGLFVQTLLLLGQKYRWIGIVAIVTVAGMIVVKTMYLD